MARSPWNKGLTKADPRVAAGEAKRRAARVYGSPYGDDSGPQARARRWWRKRKAERDPLGLIGREMDARRRATAMGSLVERLDYGAILERDDWTCGICGKAVRPEDLSFDHREPIFEGGPHVAENVRVTHAICNSRKSERESRDVRLAAIRGGASSRC